MDKKNGKGPNDKVGGKTPQKARSVYRSILREGLGLLTL